MEETSQSVAISGNAATGDENLATEMRAFQPDCGLPPTRVATHSLRRGGACAYAATGAVSDEAIQRFGRWMSSGYKKYVWPHAEMFFRGGKAAATLVPRFERN